MIVERSRARMLTSNREGFGGDDIYQFELVINLSIQGILTDAKTGSMTDVP